MNLKMFCIANQFLRTVWCTIISISQQKLKERMILTVAPTIYSLLKCKVSDKENMKNWWPAVGYPIDNGHCYGCTNYGSVDIKHPNEASAYTGGHLNICMTLTRRTEWSDEDEEAEEARISHMYKGYKRFKKKLFSEFPPDVKKRCLKITKSAPA